MIGYVIFLLVVFGRFFFFLGFGVGRVLDGVFGEGGALSVNFAFFCVLVIVLGFRVIVRGRGFIRFCYFLLRWG